MPATKEGESFFKFKERFTFVLKTGFETFTLKVILLQNNEENLFDEYSIKVSDLLVKLLDQRDHIE